jgi:hypothetical protein
MKQWVTRHHFFFFFSVYERSFFHSSTLTVLSVHVKNESRKEKKRKTRWSKKKDLFSNSLSVDSLSGLVDVYVFVRIWDQVQGYVTSNERSLRTWLCKEFVLKPFHFSWIGKETVGFPRTDHLSLSQAAIQILIFRRSCCFYI